MAFVLALAAGAVFAEDFLLTAAQSFPGNVEYDGRLVFVRVRFDTGFGGGGFSRARGSRGEPPWAHDYPTADTHLMKILKELTVAEPRTDGSNVFKLDDPELFDYPIAYVSEPGYWTTTDEEARSLRQYLLKGGFIIFDDFRQNDLYNLEEQMKRVLPEAAIRRARSGAADLQFVLRDQELRLRVLRQGNLLRDLRGQRPEEAPASR